MDELHIKYRPNSFKQVIGQPEAVAILSRFVVKKKVPRQLLFTGPSGCGKTTLARILKKKLNCSDRDFVEINAADARGIEMVRDIRRLMGQHPIQGDVKIWLVDEAQMMSNEAQNAILKILEEPPRHVYLMLATTNPAKLLKTIHTRCSEVRCKLLEEKQVRELVKDVAGKEEFSLTEEVVERIAEVAEGSARKALVVLQAVADLDDEEEQLRVIRSSEFKSQAIEIARALMNPRTTWAVMAKILKGVDEDPESLRHLILAYCTNTMLSAGAMSARAYAITIAFEDNFFDSKRAGLVAACYRVVASSRK